MSEPRHEPADVPAELTEEELERVDGGVALSEQRGGLPRLASLDGKGNDVLTEE
jgi:hypothetical protein